LSEFVSTDITLNNSPPRFDNLQQWLSWQQKLHFTAIELGLDRCRQVADAMQLLAPDYFVISIAGTNGKGSSAVMLGNILQAAGYKTGLYTSPHLLRYNERIRINAIQVTDAELCQSFNRIDQARGTISLTYFEFGTLAAIDLFRRNKVDIAVMEVGLGGRLDAVNMLDADVSLITTIDIDHEQWLGTDRNSIGREKAGIFRALRPAVCADPDPPPSLLETADLVGSNLVRSGHDFIHERTDNCWSWRSSKVQFYGLPLPGNHAWQIQNASGVLMVLQAISAAFPVGQDDIYNGLRDFHIPGRFQLIPGKIPHILDVAHNRQSAAMLAVNIRTLPKTGKIRLLLGMLKDKDHRAFINELMSEVDSWYLTTLDDPRGASSLDLASVINAVDNDADVRQYRALEPALVAAQKYASAGDRIIITGSFVTVEQALKHLGVET